MIHPATRPPDGKGLWLRPAEVMFEYGIGKTKLYQLLNSGELSSAKIGRARRIRRADVDRYFEMRVD